MKKTSIYDLGFVGPTVEFLKLSAKCALWQKNLFGLPVVGGLRFTLLMGAGVLAGGISGVLANPTDGLSSVVGAFVTVGVMAFLAQAPLWRRGAVAFLMADLLLSLVLLAYVLASVPFVGVAELILVLYKITLFFRYVAAPGYAPWEAWLISRGLAPLYKKPLMQEPLALEN